MRFYLLILLGFLLGCSSSKSSPENGEEIVSSEAPLAPIEIKYASHFKIDTAGNHYLLQIYDPNDGKLEKEIVIKQGHDYKFISLSATTNGMASILSQQSSIVGVSNHVELYDPTLIELYENNEIQEYGDKSSYSIEKIVNSEANLIIDSGFGQEFPGEAKLKKLGVEVIPLYDWRETHPLGKAEWIKVIGIITGKTNEAISFFQNVEKRYNEQIYRKHDDQSVSVLSGNLVGDIWYAPTGESYMGKLIKDAGGKYVYQSSTGSGSVSLTMEQVLRDNKQTDIWINPGFSEKNKILSINPHAKHLPCFKQVYCYSANMNKYWERSAAEPHLVLEDLIQIFHSNNLSESELNFYTEVD